MRGAWRHDSKAGERWREGLGEVPMGARWNHKPSSESPCGLPARKGRRDIKAQVVDPTQARIAASGWSRDAPRANQVADAATALPGAQRGA